MAPVKVGDKLPSGTVEYYDKEDNKQKVDVAQWAAGKKVVIFGIPGAFTPVCSTRHLPGFMEASEQLKQKGIQELACLSVNDPFVMKAWGKDYTGLADKIVLLADGTCSYTKALGFEADLSDAGLGVRCRRFSLMADDGVIKQLSLEEGGEFNGPRPAAAAIMGSSALAAGLARKLKKVLETRTDSPELLASLGALSTFYDGNTLQARRNLRATVERRGLAINDEFLAAFDTAQTALDHVEAEVQGLADCCDSIAKALNNCTSTTGDMVVATERLKAELENTVRRQELVFNFLHNYQLSPDEISALREEELGEDFFKALSRVQEIHANCKVLLRTHHQRAGLELMDVMAVYQEGAYERLWVQAECRNLGNSDTPDVSDLLKTAAGSLKERPVLFKYCAEEVANTRHNALFRRFIGALTRGGPGGMPRPIEVHAHDPLRYIGDMLAWLHQALASEKELAAALFSSDDKRGNGAASRRFSIDAGGGAEPQILPRSTSTGSGSLGLVEADMTSVLDRIFEGVCRPFKVRVEQVLTGQPGLQLSYKLTNLLAFYSQTFLELLGEGAALSETLKEAKESAQRTFFDTVKARGDKLLRYPPPVQADLAPPPAVAESLSVLLELLETHGRMMVAAGVEKPSFDPVMEAVLGPLLQMCERAAELYGSKSAIPAMRRLSSDSHRDSPLLLRSGSGRALTSSPSRRQSVDSAASKPPSAHEVQILRLMFLVNCLAAMQQPLFPYEVAVTQVEKLNAAIESHIDSIVDQEVAEILERCQLSSKLEYITDQPAGEGGPLAEVEGLSPAAMAESLRALFALLAGTEGVLSEFEQIQLPRLRSKAVTGVASALAEAYAVIYAAVIDPVNGYPDPGSMLRHSPEQMRTIIGI
eukprot:SM000093S24447  [mRNA]  locus=s93:387657:397202:+ [translate_table: standard]